MQFHPLVNFLFSFEVYGICWTLRLIDSDIVRLISVILGRRYEIIDLFAFDLAFFLKYLLRFCKFLAVFSRSNSRVRAAD